MSGESLSTPSIIPKLSAGRTLIPFCALSQLATRPHKTQAIILPILQQEIDLSEVPHWVLITQGHETRETSQHANLGLPDSGEKPLNHSSGFSQKSWSPRDTQTSAKGRAVCKKWIFLLIIIYKKRHLVVTICSFIWADGFAV